MKVYFILCVYVLFIYILNCIGENVVEKILLALKCSSYLECSELADKPIRVSEYLCVVANIRTCRVCASVGSTKARVSFGSAFPWWSKLKNKKGLFLIS